MPPSPEQLVSIIQKASRAPDSLATEDLDQLAVAYRLITRDDKSLLANEYAKLTDGSDLQQDIAEAASEAPLYPTHWLVELMLLTLESDPTFYEAAHAVLNLTIPKSEAKVGPDKLNPGQIYVLIQIASNERIWNGDMTIKDRIAARGLPSSRHKLQLMLATVAK